MIHLIIINFQSIRIKEIKNYQKNIQLNTSRPEIVLCKNLSGKFLEIKTISDFRRIVNSSNKIELSM